MRATRSQLRAVARNPEYIVGVGAEQAQRKSRLERRHSTHRPTAKQGIEEPIEPLRAGQLIKIAQDETVYAIELAQSVVSVRIVLVPRDTSPSGTGVCSSGTIGVGEGIGGQELESFAEPFGEARFQPVIPR